MVGRCPGDTGLFSFYGERGPEEKISRLISNVHYNDSWLFVPLLAFRLHLLLILCYLIITSGIILRTRLRDEPENKITPAENGFI